MARMFLVRNVYLLIQSLVLVSASVSHGKFRQWYPYYDGVLHDELTGKGIAGYNDCRMNLSQYEQTTNENDATSRCYNVFDCLYSGLLPNEQSNFASAQVLLGLMPGLLATITPSLGEISLLSSQRPLLSLLLSLGGPAVFVPRLLGHTDPLEMLQPVPSFFGNQLHRCSGVTAMIMNFLEYGLAVAAISNVVHTSWQLGLRTVVSWKCNSSYMPFLWSTLPVIIHLLAAVAWHWSPTMRQVRRQDEVHRTTFSVSIPHVGTVLWRLPLWLQNEFTLSVNGSKRNYRSELGVLPHDKRSMKSLNDAMLAFLMEAAQMMGLVQILFGTLVFSSLVFIGTVDAALVIARYILSACVCRCILMYELQNMRLVENEKEPDSEPLQQISVKNSGLTS